MADSNLLFVLIAKNILRYSQKYFFSEFPFGVDTTCICTICAVSVLCIYAG